MDVFVSENIKQKKLPMTKSEAYILKVIGGACLAAGSYLLGSYTGYEEGKIEVKRDFIKNSKPVTEKSSILTIKPNSDTICKESVDTVGYYVPKEKWQP